jgi:antitoxin ParD1/3/4
MAEGINVRFAGPLQNFIRQRVGPSGLYQSASEYIRDLVRRDYEREEENRGEALYEELRSGAGAPLSEFVALDVEAVIRKAKKRRVASAK